MAARPIAYVNSNLGTNTGTGLVGDPYGNIQFALNTEALGSNGTKFIGSGIETLAATLSFASHVPTFGKSVILEASGSWELNGGAGNFSIINGTAHLGLVGLKLHNTGSAKIVVIGRFGGVFNCELYEASNTALESSGESVAFYGNNIHDIAGIGISLRDSWVSGNYLKNGTTKKFTHSIYQQTNFISVIERNIISIDGASNGVTFQANRGSACNNSILSNAGTGSGIRFDATTNEGQVVLSNLVEGFSGSGGVGFNYRNSVRHPVFTGGNASFNNLSHYEDPDNWVYDAGDNEVLSASPFAKSGADTFANRFVYFAPVDTGNVHGGAIQ